VVTCTLTIMDDVNGEYEDDLQFQRESRKHISGKLGGSRLTRDVVKLLNRWLETDPKCRRPELIVLGRCLYEIAFGGGVSFSSDAPPLQRAFESTFSLHRTQKLSGPLRLRLVLMPNATELGQYPWEFLYMIKPGGEAFFLAGQDTELLLTRYIPNSDTWASSDLLDDDRLRILVVISQPRIPEMAELEVGSLVSELLHLDSSRFLVKTVESPTRDGLRDQITALKPHIIHFIGHGRPGQIALRKGNSVIDSDRLDYEERKAKNLPVDPVSEADWVDTYTACGLLRHGLDRLGAPRRLIFLHACEGATVTYTRNSVDVFNSLARELVAGERVTAVVAMQYAISVTEAEQFAKAFYHFISEGHPLDAAVAAARKDFAETPAAGRQAWDDRSFGTPVIYLRRDDPLVKAPAHSDQSGPKQGSEPLVLLEKEPCPNPECRAFVIRSARPPECRKCRYPFAPCPGDRSHLIVPKPGFECQLCDYVVPYGRLNEMPQRGVVADPETRSESSARMMEPGDTRQHTRHTADDDTQAASLEQAPQPQATTSTSVLPAEAPDQIWRLDRHEEQPQDPNTDDDVNQH
jgi:hypothetical protein